MKTVMLEDRINTRAKKKEMFFFTQTSREAKFLTGRKERLDNYLKQIELLGKNFSS